MPFEARTNFINVTLHASRDRAISDRRVEGSPQRQQRAHVARPLGIYMQVYNLGSDDKTDKPPSDVRYSVGKDGKVLLDQPEAPANLKKASRQYTAGRAMLLQGFTPGMYAVQVKVTDNPKKQTVSPSATFELR